MLGGQSVHGYDDAAYQKHPNGDVDQLAELLACEAVEQRPARGGAQRRPQDCEEEYAASNPRRCRQYVQPAHNYHKPVG